MSIKVETKLIKNIDLGGSRVLNIWKDTDLIYTFDDFHYNYDELKCLISSGTQWINLNYHPDSNTKVQFKMTPLEATGGMLIGDTKTEENAFRIFNYQSKIYLDYGKGEPTGGGAAWRILGGTMAVGVTYDFEFANRYVKNVGATSTLISGSAVENFTRPELSVGIFFGSAAGASTQTDVKPSKGKIYYVKIFNGSNLIRDVVPCRRKSDNVLGVYDKVSKAFFTNSGTGTFSYEEL